MASHTHTQPELSNLIWYQSQVHQNLSWASANPQLSSQLKPNPWRHYQPSSVLEEERSLKHGVFSLSLNRACLYLMESVSLEAEEDGEASWTSSQSSLSKSLSHPDTRKMKLREAGLKYEERRGLWVWETRRRPWTEGEGVGWRPRLVNPTISWPDCLWRLKEPTWFLV